MGVVANPLAPHPLAAALAEVLGPGALWAATYNPRARRVTVETTREVPDASVGDVDRLLRAQWPRARQLRYRLVSRARVLRLHAGS